MRIPVTDGSLADRLFTQAVPLTADCGFSLAATAISFTIIPVRTGFFLGNAD
jgi:hypothetical protein